MHETQLSPSARSRILRLVNGAPQRCMQKQNSLRRGAAKKDLLTLVNAEMSKRVALESLVPMLAAKLRRRLLQLLLKDLGQISAAAVAR